jgi:hypothetical protein
MEVLACGHFAHLELRQGRLPFAQPEDLPQEPMRPFEIEVATATSAT